MLTIDEAMESLLKAVPQGQAQWRQLDSAYGCVTANSVVAPISLPPFDSSAMDGVALDHRVTLSASEDEIVWLACHRSQWAGDDHRNLCASDTSAVRITTGAKIPNGATAVVPKERLIDLGERVGITAPIKQGEHIRQAGEECAAWQEVLPAGHTLTPASIGFLASLGLEHVNVIMPPSITIIPTGNELVPIGSYRRGSAIYESNSHALRAAMLAEQASVSVTEVVNDDERAIELALTHALEVSDIVVMTGGVSVGEKDYVRQVCQRIGVLPLFWKVAQKPGKPIMVGVYRNRIVFGIPGNPASALINYYMYLRPAIRRWKGLGDDAVVMARLEHNVTNHDDRTLLLKGVMQFTRAGLQVRPLAHQASHMMRSFAIANAIMVIPKNVGVILAGMPVKVIRLEV